MKLLARNRSVLLVVSALIAGCLSFYDQPGTSSRTTDSTPTNSQTINTAQDSGPSGLFPPGSNDVMDQTLVNAGAADPDEGKETESFFRAIQFDPASEDSAGPKFAATGDIDNDGMLDLVSGWNQSQQVQIHLQRRVLDDDGEEISKFIAVNLGGTAPIGIMAGVELADFDRDGWLDVVALVKDAGFITQCVDLTGKSEPEDLNASWGEIILLFNPGDEDAILDGDAWLQVELGRSVLNGRNDQDENLALIRPEYNGYTSLNVGEIDGINGPDIVVTFNPAVCQFDGEDPPINRVGLYANPGNDFARDPGNPPLTAVANAGADQNIGIPEGGGAPPTVQLDGTDSYASDAQGVWYQWEQLNGPAVTLDFATTATPEFTGLTTPGIIQFQLTVLAFNDPTVSDFDIVTVYFGDTTNIAPRAHAGVDQVVIPRRLAPDETGFENPENVILDATGSADVVLTPGAGSDLTYQWTQVYGETVALIGDTAEQAIFTATETPQTLRFRVVVTDPDGLSESDWVEVIIRHWAPVTVTWNLPTLKDAVLLDVEDDGDLDIIYTFPDAISGNILWARNPRSPADDAEGLPGRDFVLDGVFGWEERPIGHVDPDADVLSVGDVDGDGFEDLLIRSTIGAVVQWFRRPIGDDSEPIFPPPDPVPDRFDFPWQVYTLYEFNGTEPVAIGIGDLTGDGLAEVVIGAGSGVSWYSPPEVTTATGDTELRPQDPWTGNVITRDTSGTANLEASVIVNEVLVVDLDGDGKSDFIGGIDARGGSGLDDDALIWYRNVIGEGEEEAP